MVTVTVPAVEKGIYTPFQLQIELNLGKTQFTKWAKALGMNRPGKRKFYYTEEERQQFLLFKTLLTKHKSLEAAYTAWLTQFSTNNT